MRKILVAFMVMTVWTVNCSIASAQDQDSVDYIPQVGDVFPLEYEHLLEPTLVWDPELTPQIRFDQDDYGSNVCQVETYYFAHYMVSLCGGRVIGVSYR